MANEMHLLLAFGGDYGAGAPALAAESWQCTIRCALVFGGIDDVGTLPNNWSPTPANINRVETNWTITGNWTVQQLPGTLFAPDDWLNNQVMPALSTWIQTPSVISTSVRLRFAKVFPIGTTGRAVPAPPYTTGTPILGTWTGTPPAGAVGGTIMPPQNSVVMSQRTSQIGRRGRGRFFAPPTGTSAVAAGILSSTYQTAMAAAHVALLEALSVKLTVPNTINVRPSVIGKPWTQYAIINESRIGSVIDTQRRRRRSVVETTVNTPVTY